MFIGKARCLIKHLRVQENIWMMLAYKLLGRDLINLTECKVIKAAGLWGQSD